MPSSKKIANRTLVETVLLPAALVVLGYVILRATDGAWWGVVVWVLLAPVSYFVVQLVLLGGKRAPTVGSATRMRVVSSAGRQPSQSSASVADKPAHERWADQRDVSAGVEILRRGRRYDRRR
ncbi:MAG TPA: hypothetical protein VIS07_14655 [Candidatus Binatia bacterium]